MANGYHNLHTLDYDGTSITSCLGMQWQHVGSQAVSLIAGDGTAVHYTVVPTAISGTFTFHDPDEAEKMAEKVSSGDKEVEFRVKDQTGTDKKVTIVDFVSSAVLGGGHNLVGAGPWTVQFVADSITDPVVIA